MFKCFRNECSSAAGICSSNLHSSITQFKEGKSGYLSISVCSDLDYFLPMVLGSFKEKYTDIEIDFKIDNYNSLIERIENDMDDLYILGQKPTSGLEVSIEALAQNPLIIIAKPNHPYAGKEISLKKLLKETFILQAEGNSTRNTLESVLANNNLATSKSLRMISNHEVKYCVAGGLGVACISKHAVSKELANGELVELSVKGFPIENELYLVHRETKALSPIAGSFKDYLSDSRQLLDGVTSKLN